MTVPKTQNEYLPAQNDPNYDPYAAYAKSIKQTSIVGHLLKFTKFGDFVAGESSVHIPHGTDLIAHMGDLVIGWQKWFDNKPVDRQMGLLRENFQPPKRSQLDDLDESQWEPDSEGKGRDPWQFTNMLIMKGTDNDELYTFSTSSKGGLGAIGELCEAYSAGHRMRPNQFPVVRLGRRTYDHAKYGEMRAPTFTIVGWVDRKEIDDAIAGNKDQAQLELDETPPTQPKQSYADASGSAAKQRQANAANTKQAPPNRNTRF